MKILSNEKQLSLEQLDFISVIVNTKKGDQDMFLMLINKEIIRFHFHISKLIDYCNSTHFDAVITIWYDCYYDCKQEIQIGNHISAGIISNSGSLCRDKWVETNFMGLDNAI